MSLADTDPRAAAAQLLADHDAEWVERLAAELDRRLSGRDLGDVMRVWRLSAAGLGTLFGVSRQAVSKWMSDGVPPERAAQVADVEAMSELLQRYLKRGRIPAVVRRQAPGLGGESLLSLVAAGRSAEALALTRQMFTFGDVHQ